MVFAANAIEDGPENFAAFQSLAKQLNGTTPANGDPSSNSATVALSVRWMVLIIVVGAFGLRFLL